MSCGEVIEVVWIWWCCGCGCGIRCTASQLLARELPYAMNAALKRPKKKKKKSYLDKGRITLKLMKLKLQAKPFKALGRALARGSYSHSFWIFWKGKILCTEIDDNNYLFHSDFLSTKLPVVSVGYGIWGNLEPWEVEFPIYLVWVYCSPSFPDITKLLQAISV